MNLFLYFGQSGSGKSTLLNIIGGLDHYTSGDLVINESVVCIDHKFNVDSYLFLPYGVLALKNTQKIYFNIE